jgi:hypothetical protein
VGTGVCIPRVKSPGCKARQSPPSSAKVKNDKTLYLLPYNIVGTERTWPMFPNDAVFMQRLGRGNATGMQYSAGHKLVEH